MRLKKIWGLGFVLLVSGICEASLPLNPATEFSLKLFKNLVKDQPDKNFAFSPFAVRTALGIAASGARGKTQKQLGKAPDLWPIKKDPSYKLYSANRLWVHLGFPLQEPYMEASDKSFGVRPWMVDFSKAPDFLRDRVNGWVAERTQGRIKSIITEDSVDPSMRMLLTSIMYFKGEWVYPFDRSETQEGKFESESNGKLKVPFMHKTGTFGYLKVRDGQIIEMPYLDGEISMVFILPDSDDNLASLERSMKPEALDRWLGDLALQEVRVSIPKFGFETHVDLKETLKGMGITDAFAPELADFSGMNGTKDLFLSTLIHQTALSVNEQGTEAVTLTSTQPSRGLASAPNSSRTAIQFRADRPFMFLIRHRGTNSILFQGHVTEPNLPVPADS